MVKYRLPLTLGMALATPACIPASGPDADDAEAVNVAPTIRILPPAAAYQDLPVSLMAIAADVDDDPGDLRVTWRGDGVALCDGLVPGDDGLAACPIAFPPGPVLLHAEVADAAGAVATATLSLTVAANTEPSCAIRTPADADVVSPSSPVSLAGSVTDREQTPDTLTVSWRSDRDGPISATPPTPAGDVAAAATLSAGVHAVTLEVSDASGARCVATTTFTVGAPPVVAWSAPDDGLTVGEDAAVRFMSSASDAFPPERLDVAWRSDIDGLLWSGDAANPDFETATLTPGGHLLTLTVTNPLGLETTEQRALTVDARPTAPVVAIVPTSPATEDDLSVALITPPTDPEGAPLTLRYAWRVDGAPWPDPSTDVASTATVRGQRWEVSVTAADAYNESAPAVAFVDIGNTPPVVDQVTLTPTEAARGDLLACDVETFDADGDPVEVAWSWQVQGAVVPHTGPTLDDTWWARDDEVRCGATPSDGVDAGAVAWSAPIVIGNAAPVHGGVVIAPDATDVTTALRCEAGPASDPDGDALTPTWRWRVNGAAVAEPSPTLPAGLAVRGDAVSCDVTWDDGYGGVDVATAVDVVVGNAPPTLSAAQVLPADARPGDALTCDVQGASDPDGDLVDVAITWQVEGQPIDVVGPTAPQGTFAPGDVVTCEATPTDGRDHGLPVRSPALLLTNVAPTIGAVRLTPVSPRAADVMRCEADDVVDPDGDPVALRWSWLIDGAPAAHDTDTLPPFAAARGQRVACAVTPSDPYVDGATATSEALTVANTPPTVTAATLSPELPGVTDVLLCDAVGPSDTDGDAVSLRYAWTRDGAPVPDAATATLDASGLRRGDVITCAITPFDGTDTGAPAVSAPTTLTNTPPRIGSVTLHPIPADRTTPIVAHVQDATDADADAVTFTFAWTVNGAATPHASDTFPTGAASRGADVRVVVTPFDADGPGVAAEARVTIGNAPPSFSAASISPAAPRTADTLTCLAAGGSDPDGDVVVARYAWRIDGVLSAQTGPTLAPYSAVYAQEVTCEATPFDGLAEGQVAASSPVTLLNTPPPPPVLAVVPDRIAADTIGARCQVVSVPVDPDGQDVTVSLTWRGPIGAYPDRYPSAVGPQTTVLPGDTVPADDLTLSWWTCYGVAHDGVSSSTRAFTQFDVYPGTPAVAGGDQLRFGATNIGDRYLYVQSVDLTTPMFVTDMGMYTTLCPSSVRLFVFASGPDGEPGPLVATSESFVPIRFTPNIAPAEPAWLPAGRWWVGASADGACVTAYDTSPTTRMFVMAGVGSTGPAPAWFDGYEIYPGVMGVWMSGVR
jgi:hypothetical protein